MKLFRLVRHVDIGGVSGIGLVAEGVEFSNGKCSLAWTAKYQSVAVYDSLDDLIAIHGHDGKTSLVIVYETQ